MTSPPGSRTRPRDPAARRGRQDRQGDQLLRSRGQRAAACLAKSTGQHRWYPPGRHSPHLQMFSPTRLSRQLRRLLDIGVIKRVGGTYRYYLTKAGRAATAAAERLTEATIIPAMI